MVAVRCRDHYDLSAAEKLCERPAAVTLQFESAELTARPGDRVAIGSGGCTVVATAALGTDEIVCIGYFKAVVGEVQDHGYAVAGAVGETYEPAFRAWRMPAVPVPVLAHFCNQDSEDDGNGVAVLQWLDHNGERTVDPVEDAGGVAVCAVVTVRGVCAGAEITVCYGPDYT